MQTAQTPTAPCPPCASARSSRCAARRRSWPRSTRTASSTDCRSCPRCCVWCGRRLRVDKLALKLCDTIDWTGMYRMRRRGALGRVALRRAGARRLPGRLQHLLEGGLAQAGPGRRTRTRARPRGRAGPAPVARCTLATLTAATRRPADPAAPGEERYACQATELLRAAPERIPSWDVRQYVQDVRSGNAGALATIRTVAVGTLQRVPGRQPAPAAPAAADPGRPQVSRSSRAASRRRRSTRSACSPASGFGSSARRRSSRRSTSTTPTAACRSTGRCCPTAGRRPGCCAGSSGSSTRRPAGCCSFKNPCIVLDDVTCTAAYHRQCPRGIYPYWREIWLERVE